MEGDVVGMDEDEIAPRLVAVQILFLVDDRVELPLAADRHQLERCRRRRQIVNEERRLSVGGGELRRRQRSPRN